MNLPQGTRDREIDWAAPAASFVLLLGKKLHKFPHMKIHSAEFPSPARPWL